MPLQMWQSSLDPGTLTWVLNFYGHVLAGVTPHSLDKGTVEGVEVEEFDGEQWESHIEKTNIRTRSQE